MFVSLKKCTSCDKDLFLWISCKYSFPLHQRVSCSLTGCWSHLSLAQVRTHSCHQTNWETKLEKQRRENDARTTRREKNGRDADWQGDGGWTLWLTAAHADPTGVQTRVPAPLYNSTQIRSRIQGKKSCFSMSFLTAWHHPAPRSCDLCPLLCS